MKKRVLAFGDSNTWGWNPANISGTTPRRWDDDIRWTGVAMRELGGEVEIINEGLNGRTTVWDDPIEEYRCGKDQLPAVMDTAAPFDLMIIMVGSNDLKMRFGVTARDIALGAEILVQRAKVRTGDFTDGKVNILLICPPRLGPASQHEGSSFEGAVEKSKKLDTFFREVARRSGVAYLNADDIVKPSDKDGLHLEAEEHEKLGKTIAQKIRELL